jgi:predicted nucleic acid-binding protein
MIAFIDSSVVLRVLLGEPSKLNCLSDIKRAVVSDLLEVECRRTIDRMRITSRISDQEVERRLIGLVKILKSCERVGLTRAVLNRAQQAFPTTLGTLDAIHLSTAILWAERERVSPVILTHDQELGRAARSLGFDVLGDASPK